MEPKFYHCKLCGKVITFLADADTPTVCCGEEMELLTANTVDAAKEKHVPVVKKGDGKIIVQVGSVLHPMAPEHYIQFIFLLTANGGRIKWLKPGEEPKAVFDVTDDKVIAVYEFCNLHGLWKAAV